MFWIQSALAGNAVFSNDIPPVSKSSPHQGGSADATERRIQSALAGNSASYPGYSLKFNPSAPEYNEAPAVVRIWQQRMKDLGYKINVDGQYGQQSVSVARQFQQAKGLGVDGIVGPQTWSASFSPGTPTAGSKSSPHQGGSADAAKPPRSIQFLDFPASFKVGDSATDGYMKGSDWDSGSTSIRAMIQFLDDVQSFFGQPSILGFLENSLRSLVIAGTISVDGNTSITLPFYELFIQGVGGEYTADKLLTQVMANAAYKEQSLLLKNRVESDINEFISQQFSQGDTLRGYDLTQFFSNNSSVQVPTVKLDTGDLYVVINGTQKAEAKVKNLFVNVSNNGVVNWKGTLSYDLFDDFGFGDEDVSDSVTGFTESIIEAYNAAKSLNPVSAISKISGVFKSIGLLSVLEIARVLQLFGRAKPYGIILKTSVPIEGSTPIS